VASTGRTGTQGNILQRSWPALLYDEHRRMMPSLIRIMLGVLNLSISSNAQWEADRRSVTLRFQIARVYFNDAA